METWRCRRCGLPFLQPVSLEIADPIEMTVFCAECKTVYDISLNSSEYWEFSMDRARGFAVLIHWLNELEVEFPKAAQQFIEDLRNDRITADYFDRRRR